MDRRLHTAGEALTVAAHVAAHVARIARSALVALGTAPNADRARLRHALWHDARKARRVERRDQGGCEYSADDPWSLVRSSGRGTAFTMAPWVAILKTS